MTFRKTSPRNLLKKLMARVTHEVPTGPHTDVMRRKANPSFKKILKKEKLPRYRPVPVVPRTPKMPKALGDKLKKFRLGKK